MAFLVIFGLAAGLTLSELLLRTGGRVYKFWRTHVPHRSSAGTRRVLCVGDSYTLGVGALKGESYPDGIQRLLDEECGKGVYDVINEGVPGHNSSRTAARAGLLLERYRPELVLVLTGMNNTAHFERGGAYFHPKAASRAMKVYANLKLFISDLRFYKLFRRSLEARLYEASEVWREPPCPAPAGSLVEKGRKLIRAGEHLKARAVFEKALESRETCAAAHYGMGLALYRLGEYGKMLVHARRLQDLRPGSWPAQWLLQQGPSFIKKDYARRGTDVQLRHDLSFITSLARSYGAQPVILNYPWGGDSGDAVRSGTARLYKETFVDLKPSVMKACFSGNVMDPCIFYDLAEGHPNAFGYKVMTGAVFAGLKKAGLVSCRR